MHEGKVSVCRRTLIAGGGGPVQASDYQMFCFSNWNLTFMRCVYRVRISFHTSGRFCRADQMDTWTLTETRARK